MRAIGRSRPFLACILLFIGPWVEQAAAQAARFRRGDANADGILDQSDSILVLDHLFASRLSLPCQDAADANDDGRLDLSDAVFTLDFLYGRGSPPPSPWPACGNDPTQDRLGCGAYEALSSPSGCSSPNDPGRDLEAEVLYLTNVERAKAGLAPLKHNLFLAQAIRDHCRDMASSDYFSHLSLDGRDLVDRVEAAGYRGTNYGENIAAGYLTPQAVVAGWMGSDGHRANILRRSYREIGVGYAYDSTAIYRTYWGQDFGARTNVYPVIINLEAPATASSSVSLYIHGSGWAETMQVANDPAFMGASWQPHRAEMGWTLTAGAGMKSVHVKLRKGTTEVTASDTIELVR